MGPTLGEVTCTAAGGMGIDPSAKEVTLFLRSSVPSTPPFPKTWILTPAFLTCFLFFINIHLSPNIRLSPKIILISAFYTYFKFYIRR